MQKQIIFSIFLFSIFFISCDKSTPTGVPLNIVDEGEYISVDYNGSWSGNYVSNGFIYPISNYGSASYSNYEGLAVQKNDITSESLEISLVSFIEYDFGTQEKTLETKTTISNNVLEIKK